MILHSKSQLYLCSKMSLLNKICEDYQCKNTMNFFRVKISDISLMMYKIVNALLNLMKCDVF